MPIYYEHAKYITALAWAFSSWTKASILIHNKRGAPMLFKKRLNEEEKKIVACWHMMIAYIVLRWSRFRTPHAPSFPTLKYILPHLMYLSFSTLLLEEFIHFLLLRHFVMMRGGHRITIRGLPPPKGAKDDDCCVCYGVGLGDYGNDDDDNSLWNTQGYGQEQLNYQNNTHELGVLECFCKVSHHVAHRPCMFRWFTTGGVRSRVLLQLGNGLLNTGMIVSPVPTCPSCRGDLVFEIADRDELDAAEDSNIVGFRKRVLKIWKEWNKVMDIRWVIARFGITILYSLIVWSVMKGKEEGKKRWSRRKIATF